MTIRAVFLDYGNTLAYGEPDVWKVFQEVCSRHGVDLNRQDINRGRAMADQTHRSVMFQTEESMEFFWVEWLRLILHHLEVEDGLKMAQETRWIIRRDQKIYLYEEVREVLEELTSREELCVGVVSNFNCLLEPILMELRVTDYFEFILASDLIRSGKPNRLIFDLAVEFAGVPREECVHVGDSFGADYQGARGAGLQAILLDREGRDPNQCPKIRDLRGIFDYL